MGALSLYIRGNILAISAIIEATGAAEIDIVIDR